MRPHSSDFASDADRAACKRMIQAGSKSFSAASLLLPSGVRAAAYALYAFCRLSDDLVDVEGGSLDAIARLRARLDLAYAGNPADGAVDRAFADVIARHALPRALPEALIEGLEWDVRGFAGETIEDTYAYGARVAGAVGAMMTVLMGVRDPHVLARACDLGVAMQLTNIARDVGEDARNGRLYLPRAWLREEGVDPDAWLARPEWSPAIGAVVRRLLQDADRLYVCAQSGVAGLPVSCRPAIFAARHLYAAIGDEIGRNAFNSIGSRARVSTSRKARLMAVALADAALPRSVATAPALPQTQFLVDAVAQSQISIQRPVENRILWVAELFVSLGERDRMRGVRA
ncbi:MAG: phytoene/squalene synthase family protein [Proteobacteria bacterium]|nr:phytoene/squalene synthase family protein [Pseudomonadota bacterium]